MNQLLRWEEGFMFILGVGLYNTLPYPWWLFWVLLFTPDISMVGYLLNSKAGAYLYNLFHHKGVAIALFLIGLISNIEIVKLIGIILFSHASLDRVFNFGLKHTDSFKHTHLGRIGENQQNLE